MNSTNVVVVVDICNIALTLMLFRIATGLLDSDWGGLHPVDIITEAWHATSVKKVMGSSTVCVATIDTIHNQLLYSNIGDCGLMVLRHIDSEVAGYMRYIDV